MTKAVRQGQSSVARLLTYALLLLVSYGSTFEAVHSHSHGNASLRVNTTHNSISDLSNQRSPTGRSVPGSKCLVCQFHQQLSTGVTAAPALLSAPVVHKSVSRNLVSTYASARHTPQRGRAPPFTS